MRRNRFLLLIILGLPLTVLTQPLSEINPSGAPLVSVNLNVLGVTTTLPFDRPFVLEITVRKGEQLVEALLFQLYINKVDSLKIWVLSDDDSDEVKPKAMKISQFDSTRFLVEVPPLKPDCYYDIALVHKFTGKNRDHLLSVNGYIYSGDTTSARTEYAALQARLEKTPYRREKRIFMPSFNNYLDTFKLKQQPEYEKIAAHDFRILEPLASINEDIFRQIVRQLEVHKLQITNASALWRYWFDATYRKQVEAGLRTLNLLDNIATTGDLIQRISNFNKTAQSLTQLLSELRILRALEGTVPQLDMLINSVETIAAGYVKNLKFITERTNLAIDAWMVYGEWLSLAAGSNDMKIRNGQLLIPDFGLTYAPAIDQNGQATHILRPHVGINILFRPIDKTQRLQTIESPSFWHRTSIYLGLTLGKINLDGFTDFSSTFSIVSGLNYRLSRQTRFGIGTLHLRIKDENPLISKTHWHLAPYCAFSFDLDIFENIGRFVTKIFN